MLPPLAGRKAMLILPTLFKSVLAAGLCPEFPWHGGAASHRPEGAISVTDQIPGEQSHGNASVI